MPAANRAILTAAQSDRTSFGCNAHRQFTIFDQCVLESLEHHRSWSTVMEKARACVSRSEHEMDYSPPSNPQIYIGRDVGALAAF